MEYRTSSPNRRNVRTFIVSLLVYMLLTSQLAPLAMANPKLNRSANRRVPMSIADERSGAAQPISSETHFAPVPNPLPPTVPATAPLAVNIVATKTDNRTVAQPAAPGDTINYTVVIQNLGSTDATNVTFTDTIDANTTLVPNSIVSTPVANNDTYNVVGNVRIQPNAAQGLLTNDFNPDNGNATGITASGPVTSTQGGNVTVNADGSFSYNPAPGFAGTDTFTYTLTVTATGKTDTATVTLNVGNGTATPGTNVIWFIDDSAAPGGDGRLTTPFNCFVGAGCFSAIAADDAGDTIFLYDGAYIGGYSLLANQKLVGQGAGAALANISGVTVQAYSDALPATSGNPDNVAMTTVALATNALTVSAGGILLRGFTIGNTTGAKIFGSSFGTLTAGNTTTPDLKLNGPGQALNLTTGTFAVTSAFTSVTTTSSGTQGITLAGVGGTVAFGSTTVSGATSQGILIGTSTANINFGNTTVTGGTDAISLQNNSAGTRTFGTVTTSGNTGIGFSHTAAGGTTTVTGATSITNPGGIGISIQNSTTAISFAGTTVNKGASAGTGVDLGNNTGNTTFNSLSITTSNGTGLFGAGNTGQINVNTGSIASTTGPAINITKAIAPATPITLNFTSVSSSNSPTTGVALDRVSGNLVVGTTTVTNSTGVGINVLNTSAGGTMNFGNATVTLTGATGVNLSANAGAVAFGALNISPDSGVAGLVAGGSSGTVSSTSGTISTANAAAINVTSATPLNMVLTSVSANISAATAASGVTLTGATGTLTMQGGTITGGNAAAFNVSGGAVNSTYSGSISQANAQRVVNVDGTTGGTVAFNTGTITDTASSTGVNINNANGNVSLANLTHGTSVARLATQAVTINGGTGTYSLGTVSIFTNNAQGISALNADGTLNSTTGTVDSSNATAINIDGPAGLTTLGMTLTRVDSSGGAANGISIQDTNGTFTVTGDGVNTAKGGNGTGGTIANKTGADDSTTQGNGIFLNNAAGVTLRRMTINGTIQNSALRGQGLTNFTLQYSTISGTIGTASGPVEGAIVLGNTSPTIANAFTNGSVSLIDNCLISGAVEHNVEVYQQANTASLTISNSNITNNSAALGSDGILIETHTDGNGGTPFAQLTVSVQSCLFDNNKSQALQANALGDSFLNLTINASTVQRTTQGNEGFVLQNGGDADMTVHVTGNTFTGILGTNILVGQVVNNASSLSNLIGVIQNNTMTVGNATTFPVNRTLIVFFSSTVGQVSTANVLVHGNTINTFSDPVNGLSEPLFVSTPDANTDPSFTATITNNVVNINDTTGLSLRGIAAQSTQDSSNGCFDIRNNDVNYSPVTPAGVAGIRLRQVNPAVARLEQGISAGAATTVLAANNPLSTTEVVGTVTVVSNSTCQTAPTLVQEIKIASSNDLSNVGQMETPKPPVASQLDMPKTSDGQMETPKPTLLSQIEMPKAGVRGVIDTPLTKFADLKLPKDDSSKKSATPRGITPSLANFPLTIGTLGAGKSVTITFSVTVNNPLVPPTTTSVSNQGTVSGNDGATPFNTLTDDPDVAGTNNPTVTGITPPPDINIKDAKVGEPPSGQTSMLFAVTLSAPAPGSVSVNFATANSGGTPATGGATCDGIADYITTNGTVNFIAGQQIQTIAVPVCADATVEGDETFLVNLSTPTNGIIVDGQATGTITPNVPGVTLISELRTSGPGGTNDDFVEIYNNTGSPLDASGYGLFKMGAACGDTPVLIGTIPNATIIPARGHYLFVGSAYSLANYGGAGAAAGNLTLSADIENDRNVALFNTANLQNISSTTRLDAVGFGANTGNNCDLLREGTNLGAVLGSTLEYTFVRKLESGTPQDTNDNTADFFFADTLATLVAGAGQRLGAPGPENLASPLQRNATIKASLVDPGVASSALPNRERIVTPDAPNNSTFGTLDIRRKFTNNTGGIVTRLRFRLVDVTTAPQPGGTADLRARSSGQLTNVPISAGGTVTIEGTTVEIPPAQLSGGGLNTTMTVTTGVPIAPGAPINVRFLLGVQQNGGFRFFINVEALP